MQKLILVQLKLKIKQKAKRSLLNELEIKELESLHLVDVFSRSVPWVLEKFLGK